MKTNYPHEPIIACWCILVRTGYNTALHIAKKNNTPVSFFLLPLAFASHLGGYLTLIETPRNILISDFINSTASAVIMAPIALNVATTIGASVDPFLMAVAIGASSAFLTPVGHESNAFVMQKGATDFLILLKCADPLSYSSFLSLCHFYSTFGPSK